MLKTKRVAKLMHQRAEERSTIARLRAEIVADRHDRFHHRNEGTVVIGQNLRGSPGDQARWHFIENDLDKRCIPRRAGRDGAAVTQPEIGRLHIVPNFGRRANLADDA